MTVKNLTNLVKKKVKIAVAVELHWREVSRLHSLLDLLLLLLLLLFRPPQVSGCYFPPLYFALLFLAFQGRGHGSPQPSFSSRWHPLQSILLAMVQPQET